MKLLFCMMLCVLLGVSAFRSTLKAATVVIQGSTLNKPTWQRPVETLAALSTRTNIPYEVVIFQVDVSGNYHFDAVAVDPFPWDNFSLIYTSFDPSRPLEGALVADDNFIFPGHTGFDAVPLMANTTYYYVMTGYENESAGSYELTVTGPGIFQVITVPEPSTPLLLLGGLGCWFGMNRRRRSNIFYSKT